MLKRKKLTVFAIVLLIIFFVYTIFIHFGRFVDLDLLVTQILQGSLPRFVDTPFSLFSLIGSLEFASILLFILWAIYRKLNFIFVLVLFGVMHVIELFAKVNVAHFPPPFRFFRYNLELEFPSSYVRPGYSYPSGHASRTAFLSTLIIFFIWNSKLSKKIKYLLIALILVFDLIMFTSRIYLGEHWASDVIGGMLIGTSFALISSQIISYKSKN